MFFMLEESTKLTYECLIFATVEFSNFSYVKGAVDSRSFFELDDLKQGIIVLDLFRYLVKFILAFFVRTLHHLFLRLGLVVETIFTDCVAALDHCWLPVH